MKGSSGSGVVYSTWSPTDRGSSTALSNGNLTVQCWSLNSIRGSAGRSSGKLQFEITVTVPAGATAAQLSGVATSAANLNNFPGSGTGSWAYYGSDGHFYSEGADSAYGSSYGTSDVIGIVVDFTTGTLTFYKNGVSQGVASSAMAGKTLFPIYGSGSTSSSWLFTGTINVGASPFAYPVSGASPWG
ncbi:SPRY domain-containing protein [Metapseudomonas otitidis]|uniref:SPRY domain-containing protein n=1 Tax=Metapseudomonas otitidis TaxID=319939 RepID=UPI003C7BFF5E